jgi:hypothetical protein
MAMMNIDSVTAHLSKMSPQQLQQFASMHMDDPIMLAAAKFVSNQQTKMQQSQQPQQGMPPKVNEQTVQSMAPQQQMPQQAPQQQMPPQAQGLPEESGIAQLPAQNMQGMAEGGIVAFAGGGGPKKDAFAEALELEGVTDPTQIAFLRSIYSQESSSGKKTTTSNRGAVGGMQVLPGTFKQVAPELDINKPVDNIRGGVRYALQGLQAAKGDPALAGAYYYGGPGGMAKAMQGVAVSDPKNPQAPTTLGYGKDIAARMTALMPMGSAQAEPPAPTPTPTPSAVNQIPGDPYQTPAAQDSSTFFGRAADYIGVPEEYQRNISNTLNALGGWTAPVAAAGRVGAASKALEPTAEAIAKAAQLKKIATTPRIAAPAKAGLEALDEAAKATLAQAQAARQARGLAQDVGAARGAEQSVEAAAKSAQVARGVEQSMAAKNAATAAKVQQAALAAKNASAIQAANAMTGGSEPEGIESLLPSGTQENRDFMRRAEHTAPAVPPELPKEAKKEVIATAKQNVPEGTDTKGFTNDDWLNLGFGLLAGKSQYAMQNLGEAGIATLAAKQARTKTALEARKAEADITQSGAMGKYYESMAAQDKTPAEIKLVEKYASDPKFAAAMDAMAGAKRAPQTEAKLMELWSNNLMLQQKYPDVNDYLRMMQSASAGDAVPNVVSGNVAAGQVRAP